MQTVFEQEYKGKLKDKRRGKNKTKQKNKDIRSRQFRFRSSCLSSAPFPFSPASCYLPTHPSPDQGEAQGLSWELGSCCSRLVAHTDPGAGPVTRLPYKVLAVGLQGSALSDYA